MVAFRITKDIRAPADFVVHWWLDYSAEDPGLTPGMVRRKVERIDENRVRLTTTTRLGGRLRTTDGTVTRTGPAAWQMAGHVSSGGVVVSTLQSTYLVEPTIGGSRLQADFEFLGQTIGWKLALAFSGFSLRRRQMRTFRDYVRAIETEFNTPSASPSAGTPRSSPPIGGTPPA